MATELIVSLVIASVLGFCVLAVGIAAACQPRFVFKSYCRECGAFQEYVSDSWAYSAEKFDRLCQRCGHHGYPVVRKHDRQIEPSS